MATSSERENRNRATPGRAGAARSNSGKGAAGDEPPYPRDDRCQLCGSLPKKERSLIWDRELEKQGNVTRENRRGWLCYHCKHLIGIIQTTGLVKVVKYLIPDVYARPGTPRQETVRVSLLGHLSEDF